MSVSTPTSPTLPHAGARHLVVSLSGWVRRAREHPARLLRSAARRPHASVDRDRGRMELGARRWNVVLARAAGALHPAAGAATAAREYHRRVPAHVHGPGPDGLAPEPGAV